MQLQPVRGLAHEVALHVVHLEAAQDLQGGGVLHELGDGLLAQGVGHLDHGLDHGLVHAPVLEPEHEGAVDLELVHRQVLEVGERAEPRAEVVERELAAHLAQAGDEVDGTAEIGDRGGLGDLEGHRPGRHRVLGQRVLDQGHQPLVLHGPPRQVDGETHVEAAAPDRGEPGDGVAHGPPVHVVDEAETLRGRHEAAGQQQLARLHLHPQQGLVVAHRIVAHRHDGLEHQGEAIMVTGVAHARGPAHVLGHAGLLVVLARVQVDAVAALRLGHVAGQIGLGQDVVRRLGMVVDQGHADGAGDVERLAAVEELEVLEQAAQVLRRRHRLRAVHVVEQHRELVAAEAGQQVALADVALEQPGAFLEELVPGGVAEGVVDVLELVQVDVEQGAVGAAARHARDDPVEFLVEVLAVVQPGEGVVLGLVGELLLDGLLLRDVAGGAADAAHRPVVVEDGPGVEADVVGPPLGIQVHGLVVHQLAPRHHPGEGLGVALGRLGGLELAEVAAQHLLRRQAVDGGGGPVEVGPAAPGVHAPDQVVGGFHQVAVAGLGLAQALLGLLAAADVGDQAHVVAAVVQGHGADPHREGAHLAVPGPVGHLALALHVVRRGQAPGHVGQQPRQVAAADLLRGVAEQAFRRRVEQLDVALLVDDDDALGGVVHDGMDRGVLFAQAPEQPAQGLHQQAQLVVGPGAQALGQLGVAGGAAAVHEPVQGGQPLAHAANGSHGGTEAGQRQQGPGAEPFHRRCAGLPVGVAHHGRHGQCGEEGAHHEQLAVEAHLHPVQAQVAAEPAQQVEAFQVPRQAHQHCDHQVEQHELEQARGRPQVGMADPQPVLGGGHQQHVEQEIGPVVVAEGGQVLAAGKRHTPFAFLRHGQQRAQVAPQVEYHAPQQNGIQARQGQQGAAVQQGGIEHAEVEGDAVTGHGHQAEAGSDHEDQAAADAGEALFHVNGSRIVVVAWPGAIATERNAGPIMAEWSRLFQCRSSP